MTVAVAAAVAVTVTVVEVESHVDENTQTVLGSVRPKEHAIIHILLIWFQFL